MLPAAAASRKPLMMRRPTPRGRAGPLGLPTLLLLALAAFAALSSATQLRSYRPVGGQDFFTNPRLSSPLNKTLHAQRGPPLKRDANNVPIQVSNGCEATIWPGILTQHGVGPGIGGFALKPGESKSMLVSWNWQGRVWGRTNCSFNANGTGPATPMGVDGRGSACDSGDCFAQLDCAVAGANPCTLWEGNLAGGYQSKQTFMDISLVDGYNLPMQVLVIPAPNTTNIPSNLVNAACIATAGWLSDPARSGEMGTNSTYPLPYEPSVTNTDVADWCPWDLQVFPPTKPGDGVYPYPDDNVQRPAFDPCLSACSKSGSAQDCCTGKYNDPSVCKPSLYSSSSKKVCPDAYSFAFDDQTSTFIVPSGSGWHVRFCPTRGRSTNIIQTLGSQLAALGSSGFLSPQQQADVKNTSYFETHGNGAASRSGLGKSGIVLAVGVAGVAAWLTLN